MNKSNMSNSSNNSLDKTPDMQALGTQPRTHSRTDWERLDALSDAEIDTSDIPPLTEGEFARSEWRLPAALKPSLFPPDAPVMVEIAIDKETLAWFQSQGQDYQVQMRAALRLYAEVHQASD